MKYKTAHNCVGENQEMFSESVRASRAASRTPLKANSNDDGQPNRPEGGIQNRTDCEYSIVQPFEILYSRIWRVACSWQCWSTNKWRCNYGVFSWLRQNKRSRNTRFIIIIYWQWDLQLQLRALLTSKKSFCWNECHC